MKKDDMLIMPIERFVVIDMASIVAIREQPLGIYELLVDGQWITFTAEEAVLIKPVVENYFGEWETGD